MILPLALILTSMVPSDGFQFDRSSLSTAMLGHSHKFAVVCHRGNHVEAPENTLDAFREAVKVGADFFETDLRTTKDGVVVLMHDSTVDRTTNGKGKVRDLTLREIRDLKIKGARSDSERVPTFDEALRLARGRINIYMDIKDVTPQQVLPLLQKSHMQGNVIAYVYSGAQVDQWHLGAPAIPAISDFELKEPSQLEATWHAHPFAIFDGPAFDLNSQTVARLHELNVLVWPDIQNPAEGPDQWKHFMDYGVDGFQTDHPAALIQFLKSIGRR